MVCGPSSSRWRTPASSTTYVGAPAARAEAALRARSSTTATSRRPSTRRSPARAAATSARRSDRLNDDQRSVITLRVLGDLSLEQTAEVLEQVRRRRQAASAPGPADPAQPRSTGGRWRCEHLRCRGRDDRRRRRVPRRSVDELDDLLEDLRSLGDAAAPAPSDELLALLAGSSSTTSSTSPGRRRAAPPSDPQPPQRGRGAGSRDRRGALRSPVPRLPPTSCPRRCSGWSRTSPRASCRSASRARPATHRPPGQARRRRQRRGGRVDAHARHDRRRRSRRGDGHVHVRHGAVHRGRASDRTRPHGRRLAARPPAPAPGLRSGASTGRPDPETRSAVRRLVRDGRARRGDRQGGRRHERQRLGARAPARAPSRPAPPGQVTASRPLPRTARAPAGPPHRSSAKLPPRRRRSVRRPGGRSGGCIPARRNAKECRDRATPTAPAAPPVRRTGPRTARTPASTG